MNKSSISRYAITAAVGVALGFGLSYLQPKSKEIEEVIKYQDRVRVVKQVVERPDGTKETTEVIEKEREVEKEKKVVVKQQPDWKVSGSVSALRVGAPVYSLSVERRIIGSLYAGVYGRSDKELGVNISFLF